MLSLQDCEGLWIEKWNHTFDSAVNQIVCSPSKQKAYVVLNGCADTIYTLDKDSGNLDKIPLPRNCKQYKIDVYKNKLGVLSFESEIWKSVYIQTNVKKRKVTC